MKTYEFYAKPENGSIEIPEQYKYIITSVVKVILLEQKTSTCSGVKSTTQKKSDLLLIPTIATNDWKFSREVANER